VRLPCLGVIEVGRHDRIVRVGRDMPLLSATAR
jgi:hypothetical protein